MPGRTPQEAEQAFLEPLRQALACIARAKFLFTKSPTGKALLLDAASVAGQQQFILEVTHYYKIVGPIPFNEPSFRYRVSTSGYIYSVLSSLNEEIVSYQWHPTGQSQAIGPHMHIGVGAGDVPQWLGRCHLPTGRISFEQFVYLLIEGFGVKPMKSDYRSILEASHSRFMEHRSQLGNEFA